MEWNPMSIPTTRTRPICPHRPSFTIWAVVGGVGGQLWPRHFGLGLSTKRSQRQSLNSAGWLAMECRPSISQQNTRSDFRINLVQINAVRCGTVSCDWCWLAIGGLGTGVRINIKFQYPAKPRAWPDWSNLENVGKRSGIGKTKTLVGIAWKTKLMISSWNPVGTQR